MTEEEQAALVQRFVAAFDARPRWRAGLLFRLASGWVGWHWSAYNKRLCINLIPCCTIWVCLPGGNVP